MTGPPCQDCGGEMKVEVQSVGDEDGTLKTMEQLIVCQWCGRKEPCPK